MTDAKMTKTDHVDTEAEALPWWRFPIVWMVIGGPLAVVVAALTTAVIAYRNIDPVLDITASHHASLQPALSGRNLAADHVLKSANTKGGNHK